MADLGSTEPGSVDVAVFDLGGVVCHFDPHARLGALAAACRVPPDVIHADLFESGFDRDCDRGRHSAADVLERVRRLGFTGSAADLRRRWALAFRPDEAALDLVARWRRRCPVALLTDNGPVLLAALPEHLPDVAAAFDRLLFSCTLGAVKPEPAVFRAAAAALDADPGRVLFVDDSARNVAAARAAGWPHSYKWDK